MSFGIFTQLVARPVAICSTLMLGGYLLVVTGGCKPAADSSSTSASNGSTSAEHDHDHGDHDHDHDHDHGDAAPKTYAEAYEALAKQQALIKEAFATDSPDYAHDPLHKVGGLLNAMKEMANSDASLSEEDKTAVATAHEDLMTAFGTLDEFFHDGEKVEYSEVSEKIDAGMSTLKGFVK
jgi:hypothetical protein